MHNTFKKKRQHGQLWTTWTTYFMNTIFDTTILKEHIYDVVGAIHEVHKELGPGLNEYCYQEGLQMQLEEQSIPFQRELSFHPTFHDQPMKALYRIDFLCKNDIIVECKAIEELNNNHRAQLFNYMRLTKAKAGILVNFSPKYATIERFFYHDEAKVIFNVDGKVVQFI